VLDNWEPEDEEGDNDEEEEEEVVVEGAWSNELVELFKEEELGVIELGGVWLEDPDEVDEMVEVLEDFDDEVEELAEALKDIEDNVEELVEVVWLPNPVELSRLVGLLVSDSCRLSEVKVEDEDSVEINALVLLKVVELRLVEDTVELDVQPPVIDGTASTPVEIGTTLLPQFAAWARSTFWLSWS
jgi:hypothetical protein